MMKKNIFLTVIGVAIVVGGFLVIQQIRQVPEGSNVNKPMNVSKTSEPAEGRGQLPEKQETLTNTSSTPQLPSSLVTSDAIQLETISGKPCYSVDLSKIKPKVDIETKIYSYLVDFGPFGDTCVSVFPPASDREGQNFFLIEGYGAGKSIEDTTLREFQYRYE